LGEKLREEPDEDEDEGEDDAFSEVYIQAQDPIFDSSIPLRPGDRFYLIRQEFDFPLPMNLTLRGLIALVNDWLQEKVPLEKYDVVREEISYFFHREKLLEKFERKEIIFNDLVGDRVFFSGVMIRENGLWHFELGS
jgi:hypothetical protein